MDDFKLKIILSILSGIVFSFIFILLAFILPLNKKEMQLIQKPKGKLEKISHSLRNR
jgi:type IV secretory pathway component VirB8